VTVVRLLGAMLIALLVVACGGGAAPSAAPSVAPSVAATVTPTEPPAASVAPSTPADSTDPSACVDVTHALGVTCMPTDPQRVVTLGCQTSLEYALALGFPVVGYDVSPWEPLIPPYLTDEVPADAAQLGSCFAPDLEAVAAADPDFIIYTFDNGNYPQVSEIAPTVVLQAGYADWRDDFTNAAATLGRTEAADAYLADLDTRIDALKGELAPVLGGKTISAFQTTTGGKATAYGSESYIGALLTDLGLTLSPDQVTSYQEVSLEQIGILDGDAAFVVYGYTDPSTAEDGEATKQQFLDSPLWQTLKFVGNDALYEGDGEVWGVHGIYWVDGMIDDIRAKVLGS
jgi:iron complex transport system substrate-binding protein